MKAKIELCKKDSKDDWESFKKEYNRDMNELGQAFKT
jgi:hypothetical protein